MNIYIFKLLEYLPNIIQLYIFIKLYIRILIKYNKKQFI